MAQLTSTEVIKANVFKRYRISVRKTGATGIGADDEWVSSGDTGMKKVFAAWFQPGGTAPSRYTLVYNERGTSGSEAAESGAVGIFTNVATAHGYLFTIGRV